MGKPKLSSKRSEAEVISANDTQDVKESSKPIKGRKLHRMWKKQNLERKLIKQQQLLKKKEEEAVQLASKSEELGVKYTVSIAVPGSILSNAQSAALRTYLAGQIARAAAIFQVDEIVIFDDMGITRRVDEDNMSEEEKMKLSENRRDCEQMARILQYLECPQYLRKYLFPIQSYLDYAGVLNPLDCKHHLRENEDSVYREGVVINKPAKSGHCFVNVGLQREAIVDREIQSGVRVTVKLLNLENTNERKLKGVVVSPSCPRTESGIYWGYNVRLAHSLGAVFIETPYEEGYDLTIGTSDRGDSYENFSFPQFKHLLIVFGGLAGLEASLDADEGLQADDPQMLFDGYVNTCPNQGSRVIRTEEAILITMAALSSKWSTNK